MLATYQVNGFTKVMQTKNKVYCRVESSFYSNRFIVNEQIISMMTSMALDRLKYYGIDCEEMPPSQRGGGGDIGLWELIKNFWEHRELIASIISIILKLIYILKNFFKNFFEKKHRSSQPLFTLDLHMRGDPNDWVSIDDKLVGLKTLSEDIYKLLSKEFPICGFDQHISFAINEEGFRVSINQKADENSNFNNARIMQYLKNMKIKKDFEISISIARFYLISFTTSPVEYKDGSWLGTAKYKTYYTMVSSKNYF